MPISRSPFRTGKALPSAGPGKQRQEPLWKGPSEDGITFSLLTKYLECKERFRLKVVEGLEDDEGFSKALEFGNYWHAAEEAHSGKKDYLPALHKHRSFLYKQYPDDQKEILKWFEIAKVTFPLYVQHWKHHPDEKARKPFIEEVAFKAPYTLPSGRKIFLRGKYDCILALQNELFLQENKSKGEIDEVGMQATLSQNLQTMLYQIAMRQSLAVSAKGGLLGHLDNKAGFLTLPKLTKEYKIGGVLYNVVRRPLSDKHAIRQKVSESEAEFYERVGGEIKKDPKRYFMRWKVTLKPEDIQRFKDRVFHPILEQLVDWWEWIKVDPFNPWRPRLPSELNSDYYSVDQPTNTYTERAAQSIADHVLKSMDQPLDNKIHYQSPWGCYNSLAGGFRGSYFEFLTTSRKHNLRRIKSLYPELDVTHA